jgi:starvation-inducible outer membrane lipoprotein
VAAGNGEKLMKKGLWASGIVLLAIAGCATSPEDVTKDGSRFNFSSVHRPYAAAICIARNAKAMGGGIVGEERLIGDTSTEVYVRPSSSSRDALATAQIHGDGLVSKVSVQVGPSVRSDKQGFAQRLMAGC